MLYQVIHDNLKTNLACYKFPNVALCLYRARYLHFYLAKITIYDTLCYKH